MKKLKRILSAAVVGVLALSLLVTGCGEQSPAAPNSGSTAPESKYPEKPVTFIIPFAPGGAVDTISRKLIDQMSKDLGQSFVAQNVNGGGGQVGFKQIASAKPDGYTIGMVTNSMLLQLALKTGSVKAEDLSPIANVNEDYAALAVNVDSPYKTIKEFIDAATKDPGKLRISNSGAKAVWDVSSMQFEKATGTKMIHVPYDGSGPAGVAAAGGHVEAIVTSPPEVKALIDAGKLKLLTVMAPKRYDLFPDVPTLKESGYDMSFSSWRAIAGPKGMPEDVIKKLNDEIKKIVDSEDFKKFMSENAYGISYKDSAELVTFMAEQEKSMGDLLK